MLISIVLVTLNNWGLTARCVDSIRQFSDTPYEIIAVDNGSTDGTTAWLAAQPGIRTIWNGYNRGFAAACNQGAAAAHGDQILLLNNDTMVTPGWLSRLVSALHESGRIGIVGPKSNYVLHMQREHVAFANETEMLRFAAAKFSRRRPSLWQETSALSGFCMLLRRMTWDSLQGLDEGYGVGGFEDIDLGYRVLRMGLSLRIAGDSFVYHEGSSSFTTNSIDVHASAAANRRRFLQQWRFNPDRLLWYTDPAFLPGHYATPHPHHSPAAQEIPSGWYAMDGKGGVYRIEKLRRRRVATVRTLSRFRVSRNQIARVSSALLKRLPAGTPLSADRFPEGYPDVYVARDPAGGMYIAAHGIRYAIQDQPSFLNMGFRWEEAIPLSFPQLFSLYEGWPVKDNVWEEHELVDYRLYRGLDGALYYSEGQRLRAVPDHASLRRYGWRPEDAFALPAEVFFRTPRGFGIP